MPPPGAKEGEELTDIEKDGSGKPNPPAPKRWEHREEFLSLLPFLWPKEEPRLKVRHRRARRGSRC